MNELKALIELHIAEQGDTLNHEVYSAVVEAVYDLIIARFAQGKSVSIEQSYRQIMTIINIDGK